MMGLGAKMLAYHLRKTFGPPRVDFADFADFVSVGGFLMFHYFIGFFKLFSRAKLPDFA